MIGKMMKTVLNKLRREETGQALILALIMLLLGGLIMAPLLGFMGGGLKAGQAYEQRMAELYAADAGIEDAIWKIMNLPDPPDTYNLTVNDKLVEVTMSSEEDTEITMLINIGVLPDSPSSYNKAKPQAEWLVVYTPTESSTPDFYDTYRITGFYNSNQPRDILGTGFWIHSYMGDTEVISWDETEDSHLVMDLDGNDFIGDVLDINGTLIDETDIITLPLVEGYPVEEFRISEYPIGSKAFIWEWKHKPLPTFGPGAGGDPDVYVRTQRFALDPPIPLIDGRLPPNVAWLDTKQECISISCTGQTVGIEPVTAVATSATGKKTTVTSYVFTEAFPDGSVLTTILTWEIDLQ